MGCSGLTSITIPGSVASIGEYAFRDCSSLTSVTIENGVTSIGESAFSCCSGLTSITIPDSVTSIGDWAFYDCSNLTGIAIPDSVTSIGECAFYDCSSLTSVTIGNGVTSIGVCAFEDCSSLTSITLPDSVTSIGDCAFRGCSNLLSVTVGTGVTSIDYFVFEDCSSLTSITIPYGVTNIYNGAFRGCSSLASIAIPDSVTVIHYVAFRGCSSLTSITIPDSVTSIGDDVFSECYKLTEAYILNPDCITEESNDDIFSYATTIYSHAGYGVEKYADKYGYSFVPIHINENTATAKCTEEVTEAKCKYCDEMTLPVRIHDFTAENTDEKYLCEAATCYSSASYYVSCTDCGLSSKGLLSEKTFDYGEAVEHKGKWVVSYPATCTSTGYENEYCIYCDCYLGGRTIAKTEHTWDNGTVTKAPQVGVAGERTFTCTVCGATRTEEIAPLVPSAPDRIEVKSSDSAKELTGGIVGATHSVTVSELLASSNASYIVDKDGNRVTDTKPLATGMKIILESGGERLEKVISVLGDVNGDGEISVSDARGALRAAVGLDTLEGAYLNAARVNGANEVAVNDARSILRAAVALDTGKGWLANIK